MFNYYFQKVKSVIGLGLVLARAGFKLRNEGSYLGIFWYILNPILMFVILFFIFNDRIGSDIPNYPAYLLLGIIMFNFFQSATSEATKLVVDNHFLIKSINFPKESLIMSVVLKNLFSHCFELFLFAALFFFKVGFLHILYYLPVLFVFLLFVFFASAILSFLTVYFIDLENIWSFGVRLLWLATPIFYAIGGQARLFYVNLFNPIFYFISIARDLVIYNKIPSGWIIFGALGYTVLAMVAALVILKLLKHKISELI